MNFMRKRKRAKYSEVDDDVNKGGSMKKNGEVEMVRGIKRRNSRNKDE